MKTILIADDDNFIRTLIRKAFEMKGFRVIEADDGDAAVDAFYRHPEIEFVLLDLNMPKMNGKEAFSLIRAARPDVKCAICSGDIKDDERKELSVMGIKTFLIKPFNFEDLYKAVETASSAEYTAVV